MTTGTDNTMTDERLGFEYDVLYLRAEQSPDAPPQDCQYCAEPGLYIYKGHFATQPLGHLYTICERHAGLKVERGDVAWPEPGTVAGGAWESNRRRH
jgi:hypothetical protein